MIDAPALRRRSTCDSYSYCCSGLRKIPPPHQKLGCSTEWRYWYRQRHQPHPPVTTMGFRVSRPTNILVRGTTIQPIAATGPTAVPLSRSCTTGCRWIDTVRGDNSSLAQYPRRMGKEIVAHSLVQMKKGLEGQDLIVNDPTNLCPRLHSTSNSVGES